MMKKIAAYFFICSFSYLFAIPLHYDFDIKPDSSGVEYNTLFGYSWSSMYSTTVKVSWALTTDYNDSLDGYDNVHQTINSNDFQLDIIPLERKIVLYDNSVVFGLGGFYEKKAVKDNITMKDINGYMLDPAGQYFSVINHRDASIFALSANVGFVLFKHRDFELSGEGFFYPLYFMHMKQDMNYDPIISKVSNDFHAFSSPYIKQNLNLMLFKKILISGNLIYQKINLETLDWNSDGSTLVPYEDIQNVLVIGISGSYRMRLNKTNALNCGMFYQYEANRSKYWNTVREDNKYGLIIGTKVIY